MSMTSGGEGWWIASDGRWYPPEQHPSRNAPAPPPASAAPGHDSASVDSASVPSAPHPPPPTSAAQHVPNPPPPTSAAQPAPQPGAVLPARLYRGFGPTSSSSSAPQPALQPPPPTTAAPRAEECSTDTAAAPVPPTTAPPRQVSASVPAAPHPPPPTSAAPHAEHVDAVPSVTSVADSEKGAVEVRAEREADAYAASRDGRDETMATREGVGSDADRKRWQSDRGDSVSPDR